MKDATDEEIMRAMDAVPESVATGHPALERLEEVLAKYPRDPEIDALGEPAEEAEFGKDLDGSDVGWEQNPAPAPERPLTRDERRAILRDYVEHKQKFGAMTPEQLREAENCDVGNPGDPSYYRELEARVQGLVDSGEVVKETATTVVTIGPGADVYVCGKIWVGVTVDKWSHGAKVDEFDTQPVPVFPRVVDGKVGYEEVIREYVARVVAQVQEAERRGEA